MHELDARVAEWRRKLASGGALQNWQMEELEDHVRTAYAHALDEYASESQAWRAAIERTGCVAAISAEFAKEQVMSPKSKLAGVAITLGLLYFVLSTGPGGVARFLHIPSMIFVLAIVCGGLVSSFGPTKVRAALAASLRGTSPLETEQVQSFSDVITRGYRLAWMAGVVGFMVGLIQMLSNLSDPSMLGVGIATCALCPLYGALLAEVLFANARQWLENRLIPS